MEYNRFNLKSEKKNGRKKLWNISAFYGICLLPPPPLPYPATTDVHSSAEKNLSQSLFTSTNTRRFHCVVVGVVTLSWEMKWMNEISGNLQDVCPVYFIVLFIYFLHSWSLPSLRLCLSFSLLSLPHTHTHTISLSLDSCTLSSALFISLNRSSATWIVFCVPLHGATKLMYRNGVSYVSRLQTTRRPYLVHVFAVNKHTHTHTSQSRWTRRIGSTTKESRFFRIHSTHHKENTHINCVHSRKKKNPLEFASESSTAQLYRERVSAITRARRKW